MLGQDIISFFQGLGPFWLIVGFALISFLDGFAIPTLPEAWLILIALTPSSIPNPTWGITLILVGVASAVGAQYLLYFIVRKVGMPKRIRRVMNHYMKLLIVSNEKLAFVNWLAPVIPFTGAFIAVSEWKPRLAFIYSTIGGFTKMTILVLIAIIFPPLFSPDTVADASIVLVLIVLAVSLGVSFIRSKRIEVRLAENPDGAEKK
jgi:hypothetical protein